MQVENKESNNKFFRCLVTVNVSWQFYPNILFDKIIIADTEDEAKEIFSEEYMYSFEMPQGYADDASFNELNI